MFLTLTPTFPLTNHNFCCQYIPTHINNDGKASSNDNFLYQKINKKIISIFEEECNERYLNKIRVEKMIVFWTCSRKIEIIVQPIDRSSWLKFRGPILNQWSLLQYFSFVSLTSRLEPQDFFGGPLWSQKKRSWPQKNPRASFGFINQCAKFQLV